MDLPWLWLLEKLCQICIGTIVILLDQAIQIGGFCSVGRGRSGNGYRNRSPQHTYEAGSTEYSYQFLIANMANMKIVNESAPVAEAQISVPVGAGVYGSSVKEVEQALLAACQICDYAGVYACTLG